MGSKIDWLPIETFDGRPTEVLLWVQAAPVVGSWDASHREWHSDAFDSFLAIPAAPTHWAPIEGPA